MGLFQLRSAKLIRQIADDIAKCRWVGWIVTGVSFICVRQRLGQDLPAGRDLAACDGLGVVEATLVRWMIGVLVFLEGLHDGQVNQQDDCQNDRKYGD